VCAGQGLNGVPYRRRARSSPWSAPDRGAGARPEAPVPRKRMQALVEANLAPRRVMLIDHRSPVVELRATLIAGCGHGRPLTCGGGAWEKG
jgi:hypothetical protein